jgi:hypothetical protein
MWSASSLDDFSSVVYGIESKGTDLSRACTARRLASVACARQENTNAAPINDF